MGKDQAPEGANLGPRWLFDTLSRPSRVFCPPRWGLAQPKAASARLRICLGGDFSLPTGGAFNTGKQFFGGDVYCLRLNSKRREACVRLR